MTVRKVSQPHGWAVGLGVVLLKPTLLAIASRTWIDGEKIPESGGCVVALNHVSHIDPLLSAHFVYDHGRIPRYLAKSGLFKNPLLAGFLTSAGQIPVERLTRNANTAYDAAVEAVDQGECVVVYPEGTLTRDPDLWPMVGRTGAARIALDTSCPVIPVGQWGAQDVLAPYARTPDLLPRKHITMRAGDPVPLEDLRESERTQQNIKAGTERIMNAITVQVAEIRGEQPPTERFDPRKAGVHETGNPNRKRGRRE